MTLTFAILSVIIVTLNMENLWLTLIGIAVIVTAGFLILLILELRKTARSLNEFLKTTEESLKPTLEELQYTLRSLRNITDGLNDVTEDVKTLSGSVKNVGLTVKRASTLVEDVVTSAFITVSGLREGVKTGFVYLLSNLFSRIGGRK